MRNVLLLSSILATWISTLLLVSWLMTEFVFVPVSDGRGTAFRQDGTSAVIDVQGNPRTRWKQLSRRKRSHRHYDSAEHDVE